ncbi:hypothetical protein ACFL34_03320, partial [Candidatus Sumerlaeota bacterium]
KVEQQPGAQLVVVQPALGIGAMTALSLQQFAHQPKVFGAKDILGFDARFLFSPGQFDVLASHGR